MDTLVEGGPVPEGTSEAEVMAQFARQYEQRWLDQPIPALSGFSPREAARAGGEPRSELLALLDDIEWQDSELMDAGRLRAELGL